MSYELDFHDSSIDDENLRLLHLAGPINPGERWPVGEYFRQCFRHDCFQTFRADSPTCSQCRVAAYCSTGCLERDQKLHQGLCQASAASPAPSDKSLRRILVFHTNGKISWRWAAFHDGKLKLAIPDLDVYHDEFGRVKLKSNLTNLRLLNEESWFNHGIMCCTVAEDFTHHKFRPEWCNRAIATLGQAGDYPQKVGPVIFIGFGYDIADYFLVRSTEAPNNNHPNHSNVWKDFQRLQRDYVIKGGQLKPPNHMTALNPLQTHPTAPALQSDMYIWQWKRQKEGTSIRILDVTMADLRGIFNYLHVLPGTRSALLGAEGSSAAVAITEVSVVEGEEGARRRLGFQEAEEWKFSKTLPGARVSLFRPLFLAKELPRRSFPILVAYAVGLMWFTRPEFVGSPNFCWMHDERPILIGPLTEPLLYKIFTFFGFTQDGELASRSPEKLLPRSCVIVHAGGAPVWPEHVAALLEYAEDKGPELWSRDGEHGFESYWKSHNSKQPDNLKRPSPYALQEKARENKFSFVPVCESLEPELGWPRCTPLELLQKFDQQDQRLRVRFLVRSMSVPSYWK